MTNNNDPFSNSSDDAHQNEYASNYDNSSLHPIEEDNGRRTLVWLSLGVAALGCVLFFAAAFFFFQPDAQALVGKYFPSPTPRPTHTPNLTATQQVVQFTATAQYIQTTIAEAGKQWDILLSDEFETNENHWATNTNDGYAIITRTLKDEKYLWDATSKHGFIERMEADTKSVTDFSLTVEAQRIDGSFSSDYGLIFRNDVTGNFYYFGVGGNNFQVSLNYKREWLDVIAWTPSNAIKTDEPNRLTVIAKGPHFIFLINDLIVAEAIDDHIPKGTVGLAVQIYQADLKAVFEFDNFELRIPEPPATPTPNIKSTPTITVTPYAFLEPLSGIAMLEDHFEENINKWEPLYITTLVKFQNEKMYMRSKNKDNVGLVLCWGCPIFDEAFYFQAELVLAEDMETGYGLAFCGTGIGNNYYVFQIQPAYQTFSLDQSTTDGWKSLISEESTDLINEYPNPNILAVRFDQGQMDLYINGVLADTYKDTNPPSCRRTGVYVNNGLVDVIADDVFAYKIK